MRGVSNSFLQARLFHPHYLVNLYNAWGNLGTFLWYRWLYQNYWNRTHRPNPLPPDTAEIKALSRPIKEKSQRLNADAQYNYRFQKAGLFLVAGLNYQNERPNGFGINLLDSFHRIHITQYGAVLQLEKSLPWNSVYRSSAI